MLFGKGGRLKRSHVTASGIGRGAGRGAVGALGEAVVCTKTAACVVLPAVCTMSVACVGLPALFPQPANSAEVVAANIASALLNRLRRSTSTGSACGAGSPDCMMRFARRSREFVDLGCDMSRLQCKGNRRRISIGDAASLASVGRHLRTRHADLSAEFLSPER